VRRFTETVNKLTKIDNVSSVRDNKIEIGFSSSKPVNNNKVSELSTSNTKSSVEGYDDITIIRYKIISDNDLVGKES
jgi:hypothetical protein